MMYVLDKTGMSIVHDFREVETGQVSKNALCGY